MTAYASGITLLRGKVWLLVVGPLLGRLAKGERVPITLDLQPLVDTPTFARSQSGQQDLQDKQVHMTASVQTSCCNHGVTQKPAPGTIRSSKITRCGLLLQEITLELMLLGSTAATQNSQLGPAHKKKFDMEQASGEEPGVASLACELLCHVARATNLPAVTRSVRLQTHVSAISNVQGNGQQALSRLRGNLHGNKRQKLPLATGNPAGS